MPTKPISARARLLAYFAVSPIAACEDLLEDARAVLTERKRILAANSGSTHSSNKPKAQAKGKPNGKGLPKATKAEAGIDAETM